MHKRHGAISQEYEVGDPLGQWQDVPANWKTAVLWDLAEYTNGRPFGPTDFSETGLNVIKISELKYGISGETDRYNGQFEEKHCLHNDDLLFAWSGNPETSLDVFWWRNGQALLNQHIFRVSPREGIHKRYLFYLFKFLRPTFIRTARDKATSMGHVKVSDLKRLTAYIPPLDEQTIIAEIFGALDDKIELNRRMNETLEAMARAIFKSWFVDFDPVRAKAEGRQPFGMDAATAALFPSRLVGSELGEIPEGWDVAELPQEIDFLEGPGLRHWQYRDAGMKFLNIRCIVDGDLDIAKANSISMEEFEKTYSHFALREDDIVISTSGTLGRLAIVRSDRLPVMLNTSIIRMRGREPVGLAYVWGYLQSSYFLEEMFALAAGSVQLNFGPIHLRKIKVLRPPDDILRDFEDRAQPLIRQTLHNRRESDTLAAIRDALLPKLISGEIRVRTESSVATEIA